MSITLQDDMEERRPAGRHVVAGSTAVILSLAFHVALLVGLSRLGFTVPIVTDSLEQIKQRDAMRLMEVEETLTSGRLSADMLEVGEALLPPELVATLEEIAVPPREGAMDPPAVSEMEMVGDAGAVAPAADVPERATWEPRQELIAVDKQIAAEDMSTLKRRPIPSIERVSIAPDVVSPVDRGEVGGPTQRPSAPPPERLSPKVEAPSVPIVPAADTGGEGGGMSEVIEQEEEAEAERVVAEPVAEITPFKPIEDFLAASMTVYTPLMDWKYAYFRLEVTRSGPDVLPVIPKDIVFVQDCSASMAEQRLHFCRQGLQQCLDELTGADRFNVMRFRDRADLCFPDWVAPTAPVLARARQYIGSMTSYGNTDIYGSITNLLSLSRTPGRPTIALVVTDGLPTAGLIESSDIIGEFSKLNNGALSVFMMGTIQSANEYLLDLISYCNRGEELIVTRGRWDIPDAMVQRVREISRPVLAQVGFRFAEGGAFEVFPVQTSNLYLDRPLVLYGRCPKKTESVVFQAVGRSGDTKCDMVFSLPMDEAERSREREIRTEWARQKIYHLMGEYASEPAPDILRAIRETADAYGVDIPHRDRLK